MQSAHPCTLCQGAHKAHRCPELTDPLTPGFYKGGGGGGGHDHDDDEGVKKLNTMGPERPPIRSSIKTLNP
jgi:hypothetical protein